MFRFHPECLLSGNNRCFKATVALLLIAATPAVSLSAVMSGSKPNAAHPTLELWLDASTLPDTTTNVSLWPDQSAMTGRDATQGVLANQPSYVASNPAFTTRPTVHFDGDDSLASTLASTMNITGTADRTILVVFKQDALANENVLGYGASASAQMFDVLLHSQEFVGHFHSGGNDTLSETTQTYTAGEMTVGIMSYDGTDINTYQHDSVFNGTLATKTIALNTGDSNFNIGEGIWGAFNSFTGDIAEVLVYSELLSDIDRQAVDDYLYTKYTTEPPPVPEPSSFLLLGLGVLGMVRHSRRRRERA